MVKKETKKTMAKKEKVVTAKKVEKVVPTKPVEKVKTTVKCNDINCPIHGNLKVRGRVFEGEVIKTKMMKTITVQWPRKFYLSKYERFEKRRSKVKAHIPQCINVKIGDKVRIAECRPISKTKNFVVLEVLNESN